MAMGRPQKPYIASWTDFNGKQVVVPGLYRCPDGRWRINANGQKFTEPDERRAVQKFLEWTEKHAPPSTIQIISDFKPDAKTVSPVASANDGSCISCVSVLVLMVLLVVRCSLQNAKSINVAEHPPKYFQNGQASLLWTAPRMTGAAKGG